MKKSEGLLAMERLNIAFDDVLGDLTQLSDEVLQAYHETIWATTQDIQHEWVRRQMIAQGSSDAAPDRTQLG